MKLMRMIAVIGIITLAVNLTYTEAATFGPVGPEFQVNTTTSGAQYTDTALRNVAMDAEGNFVVIWASNTSGIDGIFGQRFDFTGATVGDEFQVNVGLTNYAWNTDPTVAMAPDGRFVVTWNRRNHERVIRFFDASGTSVTGEVLLGLYGSFARVSVDANGNAVAVYGEKARQLEAGGAAIGPEITVDDGQVSYPSVAVSPPGDFVVTWGSGAGAGIFARRYDDGGNALGPEFQVNTTTEWMSEPNVASDSSGNFVIVWNEEEPGGNTALIKGRRYDNSGNPLGSEFVVNTTGPGWPFQPSVAMNAEGTTVVTWGACDNEVGFSCGVFARIFDSTGTPDGDDFLVNTTTVGDQWESSAAINGDGHIVIVWESSGGQDGDDYGVFAQRFGPLDMDGDGFAPPEDCDDSDPTINPDAFEIPGNTIDENCDGDLGDCDPCLDWRNHGQYVRCVAHAVNDLLDAGFITEDEGNFLVSSAAQSDVGRKGFIPPQCQ